MNDNTPNPNDEHHAADEPDESLPDGWAEPDPDDEDAAGMFDARPAPAGDDLPGPPHPINWNLRTAHALEEEWLELNRWVHWLRHTYGLTASVIPPAWHHHPELVWELSALHLHWLCAYDPDQDGSAPLGWHRDFAEARQRLRDWVTASGTRLDRDRTTRQTAWPGEPAAPAVEDVPIVHREEEFVAFVIDQVAQRQAAEDAFYAGADTDTGEVTG